jgi:hypothetical protein
VDGIIYPDPETGLYTVKLARNDYDVADLVVLNESNIDLSTVEFSRMSWEDTRNTTIVNYTDRAADFTSLPVPYTDPANIFVRGGQIVSETIEFQGFSRPEQALLAAARANKTSSSPLCRLAATVFRSVGYNLRPGQVVEIQLPTFGINSLIARILELNYGTLDDPAVKIVTTEDVFNVNALAFLPPTGGTGFTPPGGDPVALAAQRLEEAPHFGALNDRAYIFTLAARAGTYDQSYEVWSDPTGGTAYTQTASTPDFTPSALLSAAMAKFDPETGDSFTVSDGVDMASIDAGAANDREDGKNLVLIGNEIMAWSTFVNNGDGTYTFSGVDRAVLDTLQSDHAVGDRVWFFSEGVGLTDPAGYVVDATVSAKLLPANLRGTLDIADATAMSLTTAARSLRPLPPGKVRVNDTWPPALAGTVTGAFDLSWAHRNRNDEHIVAQTADSSTPEDGTLYNIRFYNNATSGLIIQKEGVDATSASVALAFDGDVKMQIETVRDAVVSRVPQEFVFAYASGGTATSVITADEATYVLDGGPP